MIIRRERFKGHYFVIARSKGKIVARRRWRKDFHIKDAVKQFKKTKSFRPGVSRVLLSERTGTVERTELFKVFKDTQTGKMVFSDQKPTAPRRPFFQYVIKGLFNGQVVWGRSNKVPRGTPIKEAREEALDNFYASAALLISDVSDPDVGEQLFNDGDLSIVEEGVVSYS